MNILLADDHTLFREALMNYIEGAAADTKVLLAQDIHGVMETLAGGPPPDVVLLDLHMPGMNGLQGLANMRRAYPDVPVALLSGLAEKSDIEDAIALGASGYFSKTLSGKAMLGGLRQIAAGGKFIATDYNTGDLMPAYRDGATAAPSPLGLTPREQQVLGFLMRGDTNKDIAAALSLQVVTVKLHVRSVCRKLGAKNRTQAALLAREHGL